MNSPDARSVLSERRHARRAAGWAVTGFVLLQFGWLLLMPPATGIDEFDHVYRASAVSMGHWEPAPRRLPAVLGRGGFLPVRADIAEAAGPACARLKYTGPFNCRPFRQVNRHVVEIACAVDTYNPIFYALVGTLARPFTGNAAIYAMRFASIAMCAAAFGVSVYLTARWARTSWPVVALLLASLPTTVYSTSVAAPNGLQMMSGLLAWTSMAALAGGKTTVRSAAYVALMVGVAGLATTHTLGVMWIGFIVVSGLVYTGLRRGLALLRPRGRMEFSGLVLAIAAVAFQLSWLWYARPNDPSRPEGGLPGNPWADIATSTILWPLQAIGAFPLRNEPAPTSLYALALVLLGALAAVTVTALRGQRSLGRTAAVVTFWTAATPIALTYATYHQFGNTWQGRYGMPFSVGLFVVAAMALESRGPTLRRPIVAIGISMWGLAHIIGMVDVLLEQRSDQHLIAVTGWWPPPAILIVSLGLAATTAWFRCLQLTRLEPSKIRRTP